MCNEDRLEIVDNWWSTEYKLYMSDTAVNRVGSAINAGAGAAGVVAALKEAGVISTSINPAIAIAIASALITFWARVQFADAGCGVIFKVWDIQGAPAADVVGQ